MWSPPFWTLGSISLSLMRRRLTSLGTLDLGIACLFLLKLALVLFGKLHVPPKLEVFPL